MERRRMMQTAMATGVLALLVSAGLYLHRANVQQGTAPALVVTKAGASERQRVTRDGVSIEFEALPATAGEPLMEGQLADIRFHIRDAASGQPLSGVAPGAWLDPASTTVSRDGRKLGCKARIGLYLKGVMGARALLDLNSYYLLLMNKDPSISVIDPSISVGGITSTLSRIPLKRAPMDWVVSNADKRLYVSMPDAGEIAVIDTESFQVLSYVAAGSEPVRVALQPDGRYLWVGNNTPDSAGSGVTVIDTQTLQKVFSYPSGQGFHEISFSDDSRHAFVSNRDSGTLSVFDITNLRHISDVATGPQPLSAAYSALAQAVYVSDGKAGTISVIDARSFKTRAVIETGQGVGPMRFTPDGRFGLVLNTLENRLQVIDAANDQQVHALDVTAEPYQLTFTRAFAYVRGLGSSRVSMINLASLGQGKQPIIQDFEAGPAAPKLAGNLPLADSLAPARDDAAVFVVNPVDNTAYYYMEGMNAPMSGYLNRGHTARAAMVVDRSLRELQPGVYGGRIKLPAAGQLDMAFMLNQPQMTHCFAVEVQANPGLEKLRATAKVQFMLEQATVRAGNEPVMARFRVVQGTTGKPWQGLQDVQVRYYLAPSAWQATALAREVEEGVYEAPLQIKRAGAYYLQVQSSTAKLGGNGQSFASLRALPAQPSTEAAAP
ncbi:cytochrome D1 [Pseudomonas alkylphenolica]|uniref:cytochrome D1 n=1 Tax=Pseudomonas alkylphenolica TaxID=237609 RepID=UPI001E3D3EA6|nr:cytochrome D1 [Pseudomonas alkylphenolica]